MLKVTMPSSSSPSSSPSAAASSAAATTSPAVAESPSVAAPTPPARVGGVAVVPDYWIDGSNRDTLADYYELESELGRGATSIVYRYRQKGTQKPFAVKILKKTELPAEELCATLKKLFEEKAIILCFLDSPSLQAILRTQRRTCFMKNLHFLYQGCKRVIENCLQASV